MSFNQIPAGKKTPSDIFVVIEISQNSDPVKYEVDKDMDCIFVDRFMDAPMFYPCNYGYINNTLSLDGDPVDVLVATPSPLVVGSVIRCKPVCILNMEDEAGRDSKIVAVPHSSVSKEYEDINSLTDLPVILKKQIEHFFTNYKTLEKNKWVKISGWGDIEEAHKEIEESISRYEG